MIRVLLCGSVPPEWGGNSSGGVAVFHRALIEEFLENSHTFGIEIAGIIATNLNPHSRYSPPVPVASVSSGGKAERHLYEGLLQSGIDAVLFQHIAHRWPVYHAQLGINVPAVGVVHSWHAVSHRPAEAAMTARRNAEAAIPGIDCLVFVSESARQDGIRLGFRYPRRAEVIHNPLARAFATDLDVDGPRRDGWLFVGSLIERKNPLPTLLAADATGRRVTFIGEGPEEANLRSRAAQLGIRDRAVFLGPKSAEQVREAMLRAELLCVPSSSEGFGLVYIEALSCGTPVVGAGAMVTELSEQLGLACGAPAWVGSPAEIAQAANTVECASWDRSELRRRTLAKFSSTTVFATYANLLHDVVLRHRQQ